MRAYCDCCWVPETSCWGSLESVALFLHLLSILGRATLCPRYPSCASLGQLPSAGGTRAHLRQWWFPRKGIGSFWLKTKTSGYTVHFSHENTALEVPGAAVLLPTNPRGTWAHCWQASWRSVCHLSIVDRHLTTRLSLTDHLAIHLFLIEQEVDQALKGGHVLSGVKIKIQLCWNLEMGRYCSRCRGKIAELKMFPQVDSSVCGLAPTSEQCLPSCADAVHACGNLCSQQAACPRLILTWGTGKSFGVWRWEHRPQATLWPAAVMLSACKWPWWCTWDVVGKIVQNMVSKNRKTKPACDWNMHCKSHFSYLQRFM